MFILQSPVLIIGSCMAFILLLNLFNFTVDQARIRRDQDIKLLDVDVKAYNAEISRLRSNLGEAPGLPGVVGSYVSTRRALGGFPLVAAFTAPSTVAPVVPVSSPTELPSVASVTPVTVVPTPAPETANLKVEEAEAIALPDAPTELAALETVMIILSRKARVIIGHYPDFNMRLATLQFGGDMYKLKTYSAAEDEESVLEEASLLGRSTLKSLQDGSYQATGMSASTAAVM